jgi:hypothetical protein
MLVVCIYLFKHFQGYNLHIQRNCDFRDIMYTPLYTYIHTCWNKYSLTHAEETFFFVGYVHKFSFPGCLCLEDKSLRIAYIYCWCMHLVWLIHVQVCPRTDINLIKYLLPRAETSVRHYVAHAVAWCWEPDWTTAWHFIMHAAVIHLRLSVEPSAAVAQVVLQHDLSTSDYHLRLDAV